MANIKIILGLIVSMAPSFCARNYAQKLIDRIENGERVSCAESFIRNWGKEEPALMKEINERVK